MLKGPEAAARETLKRATKWAETGIEATLGPREKYPEPFARLRLVISAAIEEEREACAKIAEAKMQELKGAAEKVYRLRNEAPAGDEFVEFYNALIRLGHALKGL